MGYLVICSGEILWEPSAAVGRVFLGNIRLLEQYFEIESGVVSALSDEIEIDPIKLDSFVERIVDYFSNSDNTPLIALAMGVIEILLALRSNSTNSLTDFDCGIPYLNSRAMKIFGPANEYLDGP